MLAVSVPSHSSLMQPAGDALRESLDSTEFGPMGPAWINSVDGQPLSDAGDIRSHLQKQVYSPVRWVTTVNAMVSAGASRFVECGPGKVLAGLSRRIDRAIPVSAIETPDSLTAAISAD